MHKKIITMTIKKISFSLLFILLFCGYASAKQFTVVIDPGHGGNDGGATRGKIKEKDINLAVALNLGKLIENNSSDVKIIYTRKTDVRTDLDKRASIANKAKANLFISIHTNSTDDRVTSAKGADTYILGLARSKENMRVAQRENSVITLENNYKQKYEDFDPNSPESYIIFEFMTNKYMEQSLEFAGLVQDKFKNSAKRTDRGVRQAGFLVLRETACPSILIELGFINNTEEAKYLNSAIGQRTMASAIYSAFKEYKKEFDKRQGSEVVSTTKSESVNIPTIEEEPVIKEPVKEVPKTVTVQKAPVQVVESSGTTFVSKPKTTPVIKVQENKVEAIPEKTSVKVAEVPDNTVSDQKQINNTVNKQVDTDIIEYRVQISTSSQKIQLSASNFKGLSPVSYYEDGGIYKYTYGATNNKDEIRQMLRQARAKYSDAFVIELKNGKRIK